MQTHTATKLSFTDKRPTMADKKKKTILFRTNSLSVTKKHAISAQFQPGSEAVTRSRLPAGQTRTRHGDYRSYAIFDYERRVEGSLTNRTRLLSLTNEYRYRNSYNVSKQRQQQPPTVPPWKNSEKRSDEQLRSELPGR